MLIGLPTITSGTWLFSMVRVTFTDARHHLDGKILDVFGFHSLARQAGCYPCERALWSARCASSAPVSAARGFRPENSQGWCAPRPGLRRPAVAPPPDPDRRRGPVGAGGDFPQDSADGHRAATIGKASIHWSVGEPETPLPGRAPPSAQTAPEAANEDDFQQSHALRLFTGPHPSSAGAF